MQLKQAREEFHTELQSQADPGEREGTEGTPKEKTSERICASASKSLFIAHLILLFMSAV